MLHVHIIPATPATPPVPNVLACLSPGLHWCRGESEADEIVQSLPHYKPSHAQVMTSEHTIFLSPVAMGERRTSKCGLHSRCSHEPTHRRLRACGRSLLDRSSSGVRQPPVQLSSPLKDRSAHPRRMGSGLEKVSQT